MTAIFKNENCVQSHQIKLGNEALFETNLKQTQKTQ